MRLTLLGTGNAAGMPVYGCSCQACLVARSNDALQRTACSALLEVSQHRFLIDAGQMNLAIQFPSGSLSGVLLTHFHPDHVQGLFHLRWGTGLKIPVYCPPDTDGCADLYKHPGILEFYRLSEFTSFDLGEVRVTTLPLIHSKPTLGYLFEQDGQSIAYLTDTKGLPEKTEKLLCKASLDLMVIDCSYLPGCVREGHNNLEEALTLHEIIAPKRTVLTHIGHDLDIWLRANTEELPVNVEAGSDGQQVYPAA
jgi:phosphoribosyl 1,2-cyclic phosphate phosphodiesterase